MQVAIAQGRLRLDALVHVLQTGKDLTVRDRLEATPSERLVHGLAPAQGLILAEVNYPPEALRVVEDDIKN